jgi:hypothetical protein
MAPLPFCARALSEQLAVRALALCRTYLSRGRCSGHYWTVGDVQNNPGRSLFVRLTGPPSGPRAAGRWCDAATGEYGDLLDLLRAVLGLTSLAQTMDEARRFLALPPVVPRPAAPSGAGDTVAAACRLFAAGRPVPGTRAERYLHARGLILPLDDAALRYHPTVYCRELGPGRTLPALLAAITDGGGRVTAVQRTWLDPAGTGKAVLRTPRRTMGRQIGHGVRFGSPAGVVLAGEGLETVLSLRRAFPSLPMIAALSAAHLGALDVPSGTRRLLIARDDDTAGRSAAARLRVRAEADGIAVVDLAPGGSDFNADLGRFGCEGLRRRVLRQTLDARPIERATRAVDRFAGAAGRIAT